MQTQPIKQLPVTPNGCYVIAYSTEQACSLILLDVCENLTKPKGVEFNNYVCSIKKCYAVTFASNKKVIVSDKTRGEIGKQKLDWGEEY